MSEFTERTQLIETILDGEKPYPENATEEVEEMIEAERDELVLRGGLHKLTVHELQALVHRPIKGFV